MTKSKSLGLALGAWIALEILAFAIVVQTVGVVAAVALGIGATLLGLSDVKRVVLYSRSRTNFRAGDGAMLDGALQALASALLILPGFVSDLAGLALKSPSIRASVAARIRGGGRPRGSRVIDLAPSEWKNVTRKNRRARPAAGKR